MVLGLTCDSLLKSFCAYFQFSQTLNGPPLPDQATQSDCFWVQVLA